MKSAKQGFTLAEVLVTLTIIGVIAALTIPLLIGGTNSAETKTAFKKSVSILNQAVLLNQGNGVINPAAMTTGPQLATYFSGVLNQFDFIAGNNAFHTSDGALYVFNSTGAACGTTRLAVPTCSVTIDVNGAKNPTVSAPTLGTAVTALTPGTTDATDVFQLQILDTRVVPLVFVAGATTPGAIAAGVLSD